jgi:hypothetical protein
VNRNVELDAQRAGIVDAHGDRRELRAADLGGVPGGTRKAVMSAGSHVGSPFSSTPVGRGNSEKRRMIHINSSAETLSVLATTV